ncbi:hypothetical protein ACOSQ3_019855 [Xanthoceras sorbifolium]
MQQMAKFFQNVARAALRRSAIERLAKYRSTDFHGRKDEDAFAAEYWFERTERILQQMHCTPEESLECTVSLLQEDAYQWWTSVIQSVRPEERTWELFQREFRRTYVGRIYLDNMKREFTNLRQRQMTVTEYEREFVRLSKYARDMVATEADKCRRFEDGLDDYIRLQVATFEFEDFTRLVSAALNVEKIKKEEQARRDRSQQRRRLEQSSSYQPQSKKFKGLQSSGPTQSQRPIPTASTPGSIARGPVLVLCEHCGKRYLRECWKVTGACNRCGSRDHFYRYCPKNQITHVQQSDRPASTTSRGRRPSQAGTEDGSHRGVSESVARPDTRTPVRAYGIRAQEDKDAPDVIAGKISIFATTTIALIDPGSTHSYICDALLKQRNLKTELTEYEVLVNNPIGQSVVMNNVYRNCPIKIQEYGFPGDLMELPFHEFDVILGMDWLSKHKVVIDCNLKRVTLRTADDTEITMVGERRNFLSNVISATTACKLIRKCCKAYLAQVVDFRKVESTIQNIPTVCDFPDVFLEELPGLPPQREVEFVIDVVPGTAPVSIAPYRMAPAELKELKIQL